jgi:hypothetical protein
MEGINTNSNNIEKTNRNHAVVGIAVDVDVDVSFKDSSTNDQPYWVAPDPMTVTRPTLFSGGGEDPLAQLDLYCRSHSNANNNNNNNNNNSNNGSATATTVADADELLSVAEFLFGQKALTAALAIVDSRRSLITKLVAPSGRSIHLVMSSSSSSSKTMATDTSDRNMAMNMNRNGNRWGGGGEDSYLCLLSPSQSSRLLPPLRYCSCRSFLEKSTKRAATLSSLRTSSAHGNTNSNDENFHDGPPVCKHLLAVFLLPHLAAASASALVASVPSRSYQNYHHYSYPEIKSITEKEFAGFILDRVL